MAMGLTAISAGVAAGCFCCHSTLLANPPRAQASPQALLSYANLRCPSPSPPIRLNAKSCSSWGVSFSPVVSRTLGSSRGSGGARCSQTENAFVDVQVEEELPQTAWGEENGASGGGPEHYGEVDVILGSRVVDKKTEYLILWKDDEPDSWEPAENIATDVVAGWEKPWWEAARKADVDKLKAMLDSEEVQRDVGAIDENERTALHFVSGMGSEKCVRLLVEYGADVHSQDKDGYTALHIASGYVHVNTVKALVELGADPDLEDGKGRSALSLAQELLARTPRTNPLQFARRLALDQVVKTLDEVMFENVEVEQVLDKRTGISGLTEYLVKWSDDSENGWVAASDIGEDLVKDYEEGLEYGVVDKILDKRESDGKVEYMVRWADGAETWETENNVGAEAVTEYISSQSPQ